MSARAAEPLRISLALQGGGAHGAFTWGVLDRLLEVPGIEIAAVSGTSAGALNAAAMKQGLVAGGPEAARKRLADLWNEVAAIGDFRQLGPWFEPILPALRFWQGAAESVLPFSPANVMSQFWSPYSLGGAHNPLEPVIRGLDFTRICGRDDGPALFIGATNVRSGKIRVFSEGEITPEAIMASACLPTMFRAVEIDGEAYWDGGFTGNPALWPLYGHGLPDDVVIVQVNPLRREHIPTSPLEIANRMSEIGFNAALLSELRAVAFARRLLAEGKVEKGQMKDLRVHMIADDALMNDLTAGTKMQPTEALISRLFAAGRAAASGFLARDGDKLGREPSVDLAALYS